MDLQEQQIHDPMDLIVSLIFFLLFLIIMILSMELI